MALSTINRTPRAAVMSILIPEYILNWVPKVSLKLKGLQRTSNGNPSPNNYLHFLQGTHAWNKYVTPEEMAACLRRCGFQLKKMAGMV